MYLLILKILRYLNFINKNIIQIYVVNVTKYQINMNNVVFIKQKKSGISIGNNFHNNKFNTSFIKNVLL